MYYFVPIFVDCLHSLNMFFVSMGVLPEHFGTSPPPMYYNVVLIVRTGMFFGIPVIVLVNLRMLLESSKLKLNVDEAHLI